MDWTELRKSLATRKHDLGHSQALADYAELVVSHLELDPGAPWGCGAEQFATTNRHSPTIVVVCTGDFVV